MLRRLSIQEHGAIELLAGLALVAAPFVLGFGPGALEVSAAALGVAGFLDRPLRGV